MKLGEFVVDIIVKAGQGNLTVKQFISSVGELQAATVAGADGLINMSEKFVQLAEQAYNAAASFQMFESQTGLSSQELQKWQIVAEEANVSAEAMASGISTLQRNLAEIRLGRGNISPFLLAGVNPNGKNAFEVLDQLRERIKGLDSATATNIISQMGLSPETIQVLRLSNQEFSKLAATQRGMTVNQERSFLEGKKSMVRFGQSLKEAGYGIVELFGPLLSETLKSTTFYLNKFGQALQFVVDHVDGFKTAMLALSIAFAPLLIANFPIELALISLMLVLDDLATYFQGGNSVFGLAMEGLKKLQGAYDDDPHPTTAGRAVKKHLMETFGHGMNPLGGIFGEGLSAVGGMVVNQTNHVTVNTNDARQGGAIAGKKVMDGFSQAQQQLNKQGK